MVRRIKLLEVCLWLLFLTIVGKLFYWQIIDNKRLITLANLQYQSFEKIPAERGKIFSSDGFPLVLNKNNYLLYVNPSSLKISSENLNKLLEPILGEKLDLKNVSNKNLLWLPLAKNLDEETKIKIESLGINELGFEQSQVRFYPEASLSAQLLGFVGNDAEGKKKGYFGLEGYYENEIKGKAGAAYFIKDALGKPILSSENSEEKSIIGRDLTLNINRAIQFVAEKYLSEGIKKYLASSGSVLVMDPKNGAILAMASLPSFDPKKYFLFKENLYQNPIISSLFEPGSIFKTIVMASAIDSGAVSKEDICSLCRGPRVISGYTIKTWNEKYYPESSMTDIIVHSDNIGMVYVSEKMGIGKFYEYLKKFHLNESAGIDLQGEASPNLKKKDDFSQLDLATASFGQGIALSPIQVLTAVSSIAAKGELYRPFVVKKISSNDSEIFIKPLKIGSPISEESAKIIKEMMVSAVEKGEAKWAKPEGYKIAGKTGTAQIPIEGHYDPNKTIASFVGFAPADNPAFSMLVILNEPKTSPWGSETAAPLWFNIAKEIFKILRIKKEY